MRNGGVEGAVPWEARKILEHVTEKKHAAHERTRATTPRRRRRLRRRSAGSNPLPRSPSRRSNDRAHTGWRGGGYRLSTARSNRSSEMGLGSTVAAPKDATFS